MSNMKGNNRMACFCVACRADKDQYEIDDLKRQLEKKAEDAYRANEAANAWDRFLDRHQRELEDLRRISKERKAEVAKLNQKIAQLEAKLDRAQWIEESLRFEIDHLRTHESREIRQAHQEAEQWQKRYEEALSNLAQSESDLALVIDVIKNAAAYVEQTQDEDVLELTNGFEPQYEDDTLELVYSATIHADGTKTVHVNTLDNGGERERS